MLSSEELSNLVADMFQKQSNMLSMWQIMADNFYPERSDFRYVRNIGAELSDHVVDSHPILTRRDLANSFHAMLRDGDWFNIVTAPGVKPDRDGREWLQFATERQRAIFDAKGSGFNRAVKEGDHDFATFGNAVISVEPNRLRNGILFRDWHLKDCAWNEDESGQVAVVSRKWAATRFDLWRLFENNPNATLHPRLLGPDVRKKPFETEDVRHVVIPVDLYGDEETMEKGFKYVSIYIDMKEKEYIQKTPLFHQTYVVPRFQTISGSPYAYSPATVAGLPDARTLQAMTFTLLEAAERYARPTIVATTGVVNGNVDLSPGGVTWVDNEYDERKGASLRNMSQDRGGFPIGASERGRVYEVLERAFYLNKINLPMLDREMTAYEVQERMKQYRRENLPLFSPLESDYNGQLCDATFNLAMQMGLMGSVQEIPQSLQGQDVTFQYESPLTESQNEEKANRFSQTSALLREAAEMDAGVIDNVDFDVAVRDAIIGMNTPETWLVPPEVVQQRRQMDAAAAQAAAQAAAGPPAEGAA